jgi:hypothetical protein
MSFFGGIAQAVLTELTLNAIRNREPGDPNKTKNGCLKALLIFLGTFFGLLILIAVLLPNDKKKNARKNVSPIHVGDSVFVKRDGGIAFYKIGNVKMTEYEQKKVKYAYDERKEFIRINEVHERFFYKNRTSFIGICIGIDSTTTGITWIAVEPSNAVTHPPKRKDVYDYETRRWENKNYDALNDAKLSKEFYVKGPDVTSGNSDKLFQ